MSCTIAIDCHEDGCPVASHEIYVECGSLCPFSLLMQHIAPQSVDHCIKDRRLMDFIR